ncbi:PREDICTED: probable tRNA pseudouridine synthase 2, partial [Chaetura pelagica]|uniref:probable tRNA pseudouridine synthase 2 n=1 Tax=Chaetura pelagica TaxID=8897 RepID=UPI0005237490
ARQRRIGAGHLLDVKASGVFVLGIGHGNKLLTDLYHCHLTKVYTVGGLFGKATDDFSDTGKLIEKTTFDHITREKLERILAVIQGTNHKALLMNLSLLLEIHCLHETQQYLRKIVHEIGLELKSSAVCTQVRRIRDGVFTLEDALLRTQWDLQSIQNAIQNCQLKVKTELEKTLGQQDRSLLQELEAEMAGS